MAPEMFARYQQSPPLSMDAEIRSLFKIPEDRYYSVSIFPERLAGRVFVDKTRTRVVPKQKISKSDQKT